MIANDSFNIHYLFSDDGHFMDAQLNRKISESNVIILS